MNFDCPRNHLLKEYDDLSKRNRSIRIYELRKTYLPKVIESIDKRREERQNLFYENQQMPEAVSEHDGEVYVFNRPEVMPVRYPIEWLGKWVNSLTQIWGILSFFVSFQKF